MRSIVLPHDSPCSNCFPSIGRGHGRGKLFQCQLHSDQKAEATRVRPETTSNAFCSEEVQSSSSGRAEASGASAAVRAGEDLDEEEAASAGPDVGAGAAAAGFADISVLTVDMRPLAS